jgi:hypothetical protein
LYALDSDMSLGYMASLGSVQVWNSPASWLSLPSARVLHLQMGENHLPSMVVGGCVWDRVPEVLCKAQGMKSYLCNSSCPSWFLHRPLLSGTVSDSTPVKCTWHFYSSTWCCHWSLFLQSSQSVALFCDLGLQGFRGFAWTAPTCDFHKHWKLCIMSYLSRPQLMCPLTHAILATGVWLEPFTAYLIPSHIQSGTDSGLRRGTQLSSLGLGPEADRSHNCEWDTWYSSHR